MNRINKQCKTIKEEGHLGLVAHVVLGYPNLDTTRELVLMMVEEGVDFIELQIPFSDPLGDGATIREANALSLANGFRVRDAFPFIKGLREKDGVTIPLMFMTYFNILHRYGVEKFCRDSQAAGIDGLIIPDYTHTAEPQEQLRTFAAEHGAVLTDFISPDSEEGHLKEVGQRARGFVYCFARRGITGSQTEIDSALTFVLNKAKKYISTPLAVGFGISSAEQVRVLKGKADVVIVGSAILRAYQEGGVSQARRLVQKLVAACR